MDADHLDIYGNQNYLIDSFRMFANQTRKNGKIFFKKGAKNKKVIIQNIFIILRA
jgi:UDP-N-acetylmuramate-alanine ligase